MYLNGSIPSTVKFYLRLHQNLSNETKLESETDLDGNNDSKSTTGELFKTSALQPNRENEVIFNETIDIDEIQTLDSSLYIRAFETNIFTENKFLSRVMLNIQESIQFDDIDTNTSITSTTTNSTPSTPTATTMSNVEENIGIIGIKKEIISWIKLVTPENELITNGEIKLGLQLI